ncbi:hypothetical protein Pan189_12720 [Stratiformator vulcanicus]|uniref:Uncharacterized protein n=1 Tax=Stratiformator vulcanicus TaxID=2527980 RepID=A0A517QZ75_9PLAN|nr:hypothetical protein Pan189_12720 [Stratiformator vulcanicus]
MMLACEVRLDNLRPVDHEPEEQRLHVRSSRSRSRKTDLRQNLADLAITVIVRRVRPSLIFRARRLCLLGNRVLLCVPVIVVAGMPGPVMRPMPMSAAMRAMLMPMFSVERANAVWHVDVQQRSEARHKKMRRHQ